MYVFVYGTLQSGCGNNQRLAAHARLIGPAETVHRFGMVDAGFPYIYPGEGDKAAARVAGELWFAEDAAAAELTRSLDQLEGEGTHYDRVAGPVILKQADGDIRVSGVWFYQATPRVWAGASERLDLVRPVRGRVTWPGRNR